jgi:hypothetical protein
MKPVLMNPQDIGWQGEIECEGGPVLVANLDDFLQWHGSDAIDPALATQLHYYSPFTGELPESWQPNGPAGHQYLASANPAKSREALMALVLARWPGTDIDRSRSQWHATRPDGRVLRAALWPNSEYDRAIRHFGDEGIHSFGNKASAYLWDALSVPVRIYLGAARDTLLLSSVEFADDEEEAERAYARVLALDTPLETGSLRYHVGDGPVVVAWSPNSVHDLQRPIGTGDTGRDRPGMLLDMAREESGALVWLEPGSYASSRGYHEEDNYGVAWCLLQRLPPGVPGA